MQTAQWIIRNYRRRRVVLCVSLAIMAFFATLSVQFISDRELNQQQIHNLNRRAVTTIETLLEPLESAEQTLLPLVGQPCPQIHQILSEQSARLQVIRAIAFVQNSILYCSSIFGNVHIPIKEIQPNLPSAKSLLFLSTDRLLRKGTPLLVRWTPTTSDGRNGMIQVVNIELLTWLAQEPEHSWVRAMVLNVGENHLEYGADTMETHYTGQNLSRQRLASQHYPFSVTIVGPTPTTLAWRNLPSQLPLALIISLLIGYVTWLATARRMSFSWEINLGLAAREFEVFCQPFINAHTKQCTGVELLLRWNNPRQGWISPDVFIPLAEQHNLIEPLTRYVIVETIRNIRVFPVDRAFKIGLNVAASHFEKGQIFEDLRQYWFNANPGQQLVLELTERHALTDDEKRVVREIQRSDVKLAIDDFGTGQTSLAYLEILHPDILKIDKSFIAAIGTDAVNSKVTDLIIALGHRLNIELVAEGVETEEQAAYLQEQGVSYIQGYLYARPMPLDVFPQWLANRVI